MKFISTNGLVSPVSFQEAIFQGKARDGGLFLPDSLPSFSLDQIFQCRHLHEIAFLIAEPFCRETVDANTLKEVIKAAFTYPITVRTIQENLSALELFHGPTLSFKDFGAQFMAKLIEKIAPKDQKILVLVATSGDTGSALGRAFYNINNVSTKILYAKDKVSPSQEKQLTTIGGNVQALKVDGSFDDCQSLVNHALNDPDLREKYILTTGNSINIARLIAQSFYFFEAFRLVNPKRPLVISIPSGNFGHLMSALLAKHMGLPIKFLVAATNINEEVPSFLHTGHYTSHPSYQTISNSMDVGNPSNFPRLLYMFQNDVEKMNKEIYGVSCTDGETRAAMLNFYKEYKIILDPHSAVGYLGLELFKKNTGREDVHGLFCSTAHPAKFSSVVEPVIQQNIECPERLQKILNTPGKSTPISTNYQEFKSRLLK